MQQPLPCPFCGHLPALLPLDPTVEGNAWTKVACDYGKCHIRPSVVVYQDHGHRTTAIQQWNKRA